ncbi:MAG: S1/P1 nuclease [Bacteriovoracaceae bacterium]
MKLCIILLVCSLQALFAWGYTGHKIINKNAVKHLPVTMKRFIDSVSYLERHSTDADTRKTGDTAMFSEQYRHYLDIDDYPDFQNLSPDFSSIVQQYGWTRVKGNGTNPWELVRFMDSLTSQLRQGNWNAAFQSAADIGHYSGDPHQPLHATVNFDGKLTGNNGIHSRYESRMFDSLKLESVITVAKDSVTYIKDIYLYTLDYIIHSNELVDSILRADTYAKSFSGWNAIGSAPKTYYVALWQKLDEMTTAQIQSATICLANLWYTAWVNAGLITQTAVVTRTGKTQPHTFALYQNYPNPFNPKTTILFDVVERGNVKLEIISMEGKQIALLFDNACDVGTFRAEWDASTISSGTYLYCLHRGNETLTKKLLFVK